MKNDTIVWISGATGGLGAGLAATVPYENARVINLSFDQHPTLESVYFDLTRPETWPAVETHFQETLRDFQGKRVIFIHNAIVTGMGHVTKLDRAQFAREFSANSLAAMILADMYLSSLGEGYESGLVMITSGAARSPIEGHTAYCAAKAAVEMWVRTARREFARAGKNTWIVAARPGFVDTPSTRAEAELPAEVYPFGPQMAKQFAAWDNVMTAEEAARGIWSMLPPKGDRSILEQGQMVSVD